MRHLAPVIVSFATVQFTVFGTRATLKCRKHASIHETKGCEAALFDPMRSTALVLLFASIWPLAAADAPNAGSDVPHANIRKELLSEYKYVAPPKIPTLPAPFLIDTSTEPQTLTLTPQDSDVVRMAPFPVREGVKMDTLHEGIVRQKANARGFSF